ncbi:fucose mutarotase-like [Paramacrobiotus metropolitanus]|uniref:fucose mutarotase-like n=1 Tax=Paramacrobiotus metropolitanus TaxID=2943436 RepID=UPI002445BA0E|nr:fucose mutarotase-like [Paramacrobiotus metropolitanus]
MVILKGIPRNISPELLCVLGQMGHGDEIVLADANFPSSSTCRNGAKEIRADGQNIPELLKSIMQLFPLDTYDKPAYVMDLEPQDKARNLPTPIWKEFERIINEAEPGRQLEVTKLERFKFYEKAKGAFAVVVTSEAALYGNIILKKGVIP